MNDMTAGWLTPMQKLPLADLKEWVARLEAELAAVRAEVFEREEGPKLQAIATVRNIMRAHQLSLREVMNAAEDAGAVIGTEHDHGRPARRGANIRSKLA